MVLGVALLQVGYEVKHIVTLLIILGNSSISSFYIQIPQLRLELLYLVPRQYLSVHFLLNLSKSLLTNIQTNILTWEFQTTSELLQKSTKWRIDRFSTRALLRCGIQSPSFQTIGYFDHLFPPVPLKYRGWHFKKSCKCQSRVTRSCPTLAPVVRSNACPAPFLFASRAVSAAVTPLINHCLKWGIGGHGGV
ncbi:hypothetical protein Tco_1563036 [Tanacetum coccineum]